MLTLRKEPPPSCIHGLEGGVKWTVRDRPRRHQPPRGDDRHFKSPRPVWVNLARLYPRPAEVRPFPEGWDLQAEVPGEQIALLKTPTGA